MIRKVIGWALAVISVILLLETIGIAIYGFNSSKVELTTLVFQSGIIGFFVCIGLSILLLRKQQNCNDRVSWWYKARRVSGYIFTIIFLFSIPSLNHFDLYEIIPRVLVLIIAYLLLKPSNNHLNDRYEKDSL